MWHTLLDVTVQKLLQSVYIYVSYRKIKTRLSLFWTTLYFVYDQIQLFSPRQTLLSYQSTQPSYKSVKMFTKHCSHGVQVVSGKEWPNPLQPSAIILFANQFPCVPVIRRCLVAAPPGRAAQQPMRVGHDATRRAWQTHAVSRSPIVELTGRMSCVLKTRFGKVIIEFWWPFRQKSGVAR